MSLSFYSGYVILIIFVPLIVFVLVLEWRRVELSDYQHIPLVAINGTFHLANTACGPVQGFVTFNIVSYFFFLKIMNF